MHWQWSDENELHLLPRASNGLHHFNYGDTIREVETNREATVLHRTTLTATVKWKDTKRVQVIEQLDSSYMSMSFITY